MNLEELTKEEQRLAAELKLCKTRKKALKNHIESLSNEWFRNNRHANISILEIDKIIGEVINEDISDEEVKSHLNNRLQEMKIS